MPVFYGFFVNFSLEQLPLILGKTLFAQSLWIADNHTCPCFGPLFKYVNLYLLVFVTTSPALHLAWKKFKQFPFADRVPILRILAKCTDSSVAYIRQ